MHKDRKLVLIAFIALFPAIGILVLAGWIPITDLHTLATEIVAGLVITLATTGAVLWIRNGKDAKSLQKDFQDVIVCTKVAALR